MCRVRVLVALGGNAMTGPDGRARPEDQIAAAEVAMEAVADLVASGVDVAITHGNGPQVGNILVKNELSAAVVPPVPLDWCVAQTQATLGFVLMNALQPALARRGVDRPVAALVTRTLVGRDDPGFDHPHQADRPLPASGGGGGSSSSTASGSRTAVSGAGGASSRHRTRVRSSTPGRSRRWSTRGTSWWPTAGEASPVVREADGSLRGVEAVIDKDLGAALLADAIQADRLVIATDVEHAVLDFGTDRARPIETVDVATMRTYAAAGQFASGSMGPKVEAICRFVERAGQPGVITSLDQPRRGVRGETGTIVVPDASPEPLQHRPDRPVPPDVRDRPARER